MKCSRYIFVIFILTFSCSCDFAKRKVKSGINRIARETGDLVDEFLILHDRTIKRNVLDSEICGVRIFF